MTEASLFFNSEDTNKIPTLNSILIGSIPIMFDAAMRIVGWAACFTYYPFLGASGLALLSVAGLVTLLKLFCLGGCKTRKGVLKFFLTNWFAFPLSPILFCTNSSESKKVSKRYYAINRIISSCLLLLWLTILLAATVAAGGKPTVPTDDYVNKSSTNQTDDYINKSFFLHIPGEDHVDHHLCSNICLATQNWTETEIKTCLYSAQLKPWDFYILYTVVFVFASVVITDSILLLCNTKLSLSNKLLFSHVDL
jgi:hypothetical protein